MCLGCVVNESVERVWRFVLHSYESGLWEGWSFFLWKVVKIFRIVVARCFYVCNMHILLFLLYAGSIWHGKKLTCCLPVRPIFYFLFAMLFSVCFVKIGLFYTSKCLSDLTSVEKSESVKRYAFLKFEISNEAFWKMTERHRRKEYLLFTVGCQRFQFEFQMRPSSFVIPGRRFLLPKRETALMTNYEHTATFFFHAHLKQECAVIISWRSRNKSRIDTATRTNARQTHAW